MTEEEDTELDSFSQREAASLVRNRRKELASAKAQLSRFSHRQFLRKAQHARGSISFIENLVVTQESNEQAQ